MGKKTSRWTLGLLIVAFICSLIPLFIAARYNVPAYDDYFNGVEPHLTWEKTHSIFQVLKAAWQTMRNFYNSWQGSFTALFLFAIQPAVFGESYYTLVPWMMLLPLIGGIYCFIITLFHHVFGGEKEHAAIIATILCILCTQYLPSPVNAFYWYTGSVYYNFFFALSLFAYSGLLKWIVDPSKKQFDFRTLMVTLLLFLVGGGNLVTGLLTAVLLTFAEVWLIVRKHPKRFTFMVPFIGFMIGFMLNVLAPGNSQRQTFFTQPGLFGALYLAFREAGYSVFKWASLPAIALFVIALPFYRSMVLKTGFRFPKPWLITGFSVCLIAVMYYPPMFAMGYCHNIWRIVNCAYFGTMVLAAINIYYWEGWLLNEHPEWSIYDRIIASRKWSLVSILVILGIFLLGTFICPPYEVSAISAIKSSINGEFDIYEQSYRERLAILHDPEIKDAVLKAFPVHPYVLWYRDYDQGEEGDPLVAAWYEKNSVITR